MGSCNFVVFEKNILLIKKKTGLPLRNRSILSSLVWLQTELGSSLSLFDYKFFMSEGKKNHAVTIFLELKVAPKCL